MSDFSLTLGTNPADPLALPQIVSGNVDWDRSGQYNGVFVYGKQKKIETTLSTTAGDPADSTGLDKNYDDTLEASWTPDLSKKDVKYNQVYVRYTTSPLSGVYANYDHEDNKTPIGYRDFEPNLVREYTVGGVPVDEDDQLAYGFVKKGAEWERLKESGFLLDASNEGNAPSLKFIANATTTDNNKGNLKAVTISLSGYTRQVTTNYVMPTNTDFAPYKTMVKDQYRNESIYQSRRLDPSNTVTDGPGVKDSTEQDSYTTTIGERDKQSNISATLVLDGDFEINDGGLRSLRMGDRLTTIKMYLQPGALGGPTHDITINLPITNVQYNPDIDTTTITVGRI